MANSAQMVLPGGRRGDEAVVVRVEERREGLRLDRVEVGEGVVVERRVLAERGRRQRLQVEQLGVRRVLVGQDELPEGDGSVVSAPSQRSETMRM